MKFKNKENEKVTTEDGRVIWISRAVATASVILGFDKKIDEPNCYILGVKRGKAVTNTGKWCLPCGYLDWDESGEEGVRRELWEETNLDIDELLSSNQNWDYFDSPFKVVTDPSLDDLQNVTLYYGAIFNFNKIPNISKKNAAKGEIEKVEWIPVADLSNRNWAFNHEQRIDDFMELSFT